MVDEHRPLDNHEHVDTTEKVVVTTKEEPQARTYIHEDTDRYYDDRDYDKHPRTFEDDYTVYRDKAGMNISWRAIIAGVVTFIASGIVLSLIGTAIGFGVPTLTSSQPFEGVGTGLIIWSILSLVIALGLAGYIAGITANKAGLVHGFLTWATSVIVLVFMLTSVVSSAFGFIGNVLAPVGQVTGDVAGTVVDTAVSLSEDAFAAIGDNLTIDTENLDASVQEVLEDTDIPELQPNYIQSQLDATTQDIADAGYAVVVEGQDMGEVFDDLTRTIEERVSNITTEVDRDALVSAVEANTDLNDEEVEAAVDNIETAYNETTAQAAQLIEDAQVALTDLQAEAEVIVEDTVEVAEDVTNELAKYSLYAFVGLILGLIVTALAAHYGAKVTIPVNDALAQRNPNTRL